MIKPRIDITHLFIAAGAIASAASMYGTTQYMLLHTDTLGAIAAALVLSVAIYFCYDTALSNKKLSSAIYLIAAIGLSGLSAYTIYQNNSTERLTVQKTALLEKYKADHAKQTTLKSDLRASAATLKASIKSLQDQNTKAGDEAAMRVNRNKSGDSWYAGNLHKQIKENNTLITQYQSELNALNTKISAITYPERPTINLPMDWSVLARSALFDFTIPLFLLFKAGYTAQQRREEIAQLKTVQQAITELDAKLQEFESSRSIMRTAFTDAHEAAKKASLHLHQKLQDKADALSKDLQQATLTLNKSIAHATGTAANPDVPTPNPIAHATGTASGSIAPTSNPAAHATGTAMGILTDHEAQQLIQNQSIPADDSGYITLASIMSATGWGRPKATGLLKSSYQSGHLSRTKRGNGYVYAYPNNAAQAQTDLLDSSNIITLKAVREVTA